MLGFRGAPRGTATVYPVAQFFARFEEGHQFFLDWNGDASSRIAAGSCVTALNGKCAEAAKFHAFSARERSRHFGEDGRNNKIGIVGTQMRMASGSPSRPKSSVASKPCARISRISSADRWPM